MDANGFRVLLDLAFSDTLSVETAEEEKEAKTKRTLEAKAHKNKS